VRREVSEEFFVTRLGLNTHQNVLVSIFSFHFMAIMSFGLRQTHFCDGSEHAPQFRFGFLELGLCLL